MWKDGFSRFILLDNGVIHRVYGVWSQLLCLLPGWYRLAAEDETLCWFW